MVQNDKRDLEVVSTTIRPEDVGSIDILGAPSSEPTPEEVLVEEAVGKKREKLNWSPVKSSKIIKRLNAAAEAIINLGTKHYRNDGSTKYIAFTKGNRRSVVCIYLSKASARISVGKLDDKKTVWPKDLNYKVTEDGYLLNGKKVKLNTIVAKVKTFIGAKGW